MPDWIERRRDEDPRHTFVTGRGPVCGRCGMHSDETFRLPAGDQRALVCPVDRRRG